MRWIGWWINRKKRILAFDPYYSSTDINTENDIDVDKQVMICSVDFSQYGSSTSSNEMYSNFNKETLKYDTKSRFVIFDDNNLSIWIMWYRRTI